MSRHTLLLVALLAALPCTAGAQAAERPEPIKDNSFLIEEAYNQEAGVVQHISTFAHPREGSDWAYSFTQEWPVRGMRHQLSATVPLMQLSDGITTHRGMGDVAINYRYQLVGLDGGALAVAPRLSVLLPSGSAAFGTGVGGTGLQVNLPVSLQLSERLVAHSNAGATYTHAARNAAGERAAATSYNLGQSVVWLATPTVNLMLETVWASTAVVAGPARTDRTQSLVVSPGVRWAHNLPRGLQVVPGLAWPIGVGPSRGEQSLYTYLSFEHPF